MEVGDQIILYAGSSASAECGCGDLGCACSCSFSPSLAAGDLSCLSSSSSSSTSPVEPLFSAPTPQHPAIWRLLRRRLLRPPVPAVALCTPIHGQALLAHVQTPMRRAHHSRAPVRAPLARSPHRGHIESTPCFFSTEVLGHCCNGKSLLPLACTTPCRPP